MTSTTDRGGIVVGVDPVKNRHTALARGRGVGRRGRGGYTGTRVGSVVHGLPHRAHCPVITVPAG
ncbi:hypothetical protein ACFY8W_05115 [Streptomyces sp. NPDC012637]|uniref:hypothetical protein n=1 Tax=Streptomyces sp. NPDC012637 TaxID=3364842 RepID=UPI0036E969CD